MSGNTVTRNGITAWTENPDNKKYPILKVQDHDAVRVTIHLGVSTFSNVCGDQQQTFRVRWRDMNDPPITAYWVVKANTNANVEELKQDRRDSAPVIYRLMGKNSNSHIYGSASGNEWSMIVRNDSRDEVVARARLEIRTVEGDVSQSARKLEGIDETMEQSGVNRNPFAIFDFVFHPLASANGPSENASNSNEADNVQAHAQRKRDREEADLQYPSTNRGNSVTAEEYQAKRTRASAFEPQCASGSTGSGNRANQCASLVYPAPGVQSSASMQTGAYIQPTFPIPVYHGQPEDTRVAQISRHLAHLSHKKEVLENILLDKVRVLETEVQGLEELVNRFGAQGR
ncbi:hypothetical protein BJ165DRAFT_1408870 [Panaeolus papilionaceus]|nr:hypothetical protein BJ165DRAFT_1408870 [Panaeolus papilionaceus]